MRLINLSVRNLNNGPILRKFLLIYNVRQMSNTSVLPFVHCLHLFLTRNSERK